MSKNQIKLSEFTLLSATALLVAFKVRALDQVEGHPPSFSLETRVHYGISTLKEIVSKPVTLEEIQSMELFIMKELDWKVSTHTSSEVAFYSTRKFWTECLKKSPESFPEGELLPTVQQFVKIGLLHQECYFYSYGEIAVASIVATFELALFQEGIKFLAWIKEFMPVEVVRSGHQTRVDSLRKWLLSTVLQFLKDPAAISAIKTSLMHDWVSLLAGENEPQVASKTPLRASTSATPISCGDNDWKSHSRSDLQTKDTLNSSQPSPRNAPTPVKLTLKENGLEIEGQMKNEPVSKGSYTVMKKRRQTAKVVTIKALLRKTTPDNGQLKAKF